MNKVKKYQKKLLSKKLTPYDKAVLWSEASIYLSKIKELVDKQEVMSLEVFDLVRYLDHTLETIFWAKKNEQTN